jgi:lipopolysaccharide export LptBFGC system permease protein LptF
MAVFVAVLHEFARLRTDGTLAAARRRRGGVRRLVAPVLAAAVVVAALTFVSNTAILPRANERLAAVLAGRPASATSIPRSDREMTVGELRAAARRARAEARTDAAPQVRALAAVYEIEVQKKYALAAACVVLSLTGMAISLIVSRGGRGAAGLVIGASVAVFGAYYALLVTGEDLAERLVVSPVVGMWGANALLLGAALLLVLWRRRASVEPAGAPTVAMRG